MPHNQSRALPAAQLTFTIDEVATLLGISRSTAYECAHRGELPVLRFGRRLVVTRSTLVRLLGDESMTTSNRTSDERERPSRNRWIRVSAEPTGAVAAEGTSPRRRRSTG